MKRTVKDLVNLRGKVVLVRVDFNVPLDNAGRILDTTRIDQALPTISTSLSKGQKWLLCPTLAGQRVMKFASHFGR